MLTQQDVVVDPVLGNISMKYTNESFIADQVLPVIPVAKQTGKYYVYDKSNFRIDKSNRAAGAGANEVDFGFEAKGTYSCDDHALKGKVPFEIQEQADAALNPLVDETENVTEKLMLDKEKNAADLLTSSSNLTQYTGLSGTSQWSDYSNSDPIGDVRTGRQTIHAASFKKPNTLILGKQVYDILLDHPQIIERIKYSALGIVTPELIARVFQVEKVIVGEAGYNTQAEGQTASLSYIWGRNAILAYISPRVSIKMVSLGATFTYKNRIVERWDDRDARATYVRVGDDNYDQKIIAAACGYLIQTAVSA